MSEAVDDGSPSKDVVQAEVVVETPVAVPAEPESNEKEVTVQPDSLQTASVEEAAAEFLPHATAAAVNDSATTERKFVKQRPRKTSASAPTPTAAAAGGKARAKQRPRKSTAQTEAKAKGKSPTKKKTGVKPKFEGKPAMTYEGVPQKTLPGGWPEGWIERRFQRISGESQGQQDSYFYPPPDHKYRLRSVKEVQRFIVALNTSGGNAAVAWKQRKNGPTQA